MRGRRDMVGARKEERQGRADLERIVRLVLAIKAALGPRTPMRLVHVLQAVALAEGPVGRREIAMAVRSCPSTAHVDLDALGDHRRDGRPAPRLIEERWDTLEAGRLVYSLTPKGWAILSALIGAAGL